MSKRDGEKLLDDEVVLWEFSAKIERFDAVVLCVPLPFICVIHSSADGMHLANFSLSHKSKLTYSFLSMEASSRFSDTYFL